MTYRRINTGTPGTNIGRDRPIDVTYENEAGERVRLEATLDAAQTLPETCEYLPCGREVEVKEYLPNQSNPAMSHK